MLSASCLKSLVMMFRVGSRDVRRTLHKTLKALSTVEVAEGF